MNVFLCFFILWSLWIGATIYKWGCWGWDLFWFGLVCFGSGLMDWARIVVGLGWIGLDVFGYIDREYGFWFWLIWYYEDGGGKGLSLSLIWKFGNGLLEY